MATPARPLVATPARPKVAVLYSGRFYGNATPSAWVASHLKNLIRPNAASVFVAVSVDNWCHHSGNVSGDDLRDEQNDHERDAPRQHAAEKVAHAEEAAREQREQHRKSRGDAIGRRALQNVTVGLGANRAGDVLYVLASSPALCVSRLYR